MQNLTNLQDHPNFDHPNCWYKESDFGKNRERKSDTVTELNVLDNALIDKAPVGGSHFV